METGLTLIQDLAVVMAVAAFTTLVCHRLRIPVVLGYILAGLIIGPHTPPYSLVKDQHSIHTLSELGIVFLLFAIGLEFSISKLFKVGLVACVAAFFEILLMIGMGYGLGRAFHWNFNDSLFLGAILAISSTTIIAKVLIEKKLIGEKFAQVILGILIIEDLLAIIIIAVLPNLAATHAFELNAALFALLRVLGFTFVTLLAGFLIVPRLLRYVEKLESAETLVVSVLGFCFAGALAAVKCGFSVALGAFLMGAIVAETKQAKKVVHQIEPIRDMFTAIFFVAVGMMIRPSVIAEYWMPIAVITAVTILGKIFSCSLATFMMGYKPETSLMVGLGLAQIGEFSFIIANLGESSNVTSSFIYPVAVSVSAITTLTTPFLMQHNTRIVGALRRMAPESFGTFLGLYTAWVRSFRKQGPAQPASFWQRLRMAPVIHRKIEKIVEDVLGPPEIQPKKAEHDNYSELTRLIREEYPWEVETEDFMVPFNESALTQKLSSLRLRSETGASVIGVYRDTESLMNPSAETTLMPGDVLLLLGSRQQLSAAVVFLQKMAVQPPPHNRQGTPKTFSLAIASGSPAAGKTVGELKLKRKSGAMILGIQKDGQAVHNPGSDALIEEGDILMLFGWPDEIDAACRLLQA